jgi:hypothetical protein
MTALPREGDRYQARDDVTVKLMAMHGEAGMSFSAAVVPRGEVVEIEGDVSSDELCAVPVRYEELESLLVPPGDLAMPAYGGYMLLIEASQLFADFDRVFT